MTYDFIVTPTVAQMEDAAATKSSGGGSAGSWAGGKQDRGAASSSSFAQALRDEGRSGYGSETEVEAEGMLQELGEMMGSCEELRCVRGCWCRAQLGTCVAFEPMFVYALVAARLYLKHPLPPDHTMCSP